MTEITARSWLYVPGHEERKITRARTAGSDAVIFDLEDGVPCPAKPTARALLRDELGHGSFDAQVWVRLNSPADGDEWRADLEAVLPARPSGFVLPKVSNGDQVRAVAEVIARVEEAGADAPALALIVTELPAGVIGMRQALRSSPRARVAFWGSEDLSAELGARRVKGPDGAFLDVFAFVRSSVLVEAAAAGLRAVDTPFLEIDDLEGLRREALEASWMGFVGKQVIHPAHVATVNDAFTPTAEEIESAQRVVDAFSGTGGGALRVDGAMVDSPHLKRSRRVLALARRAGVA